MNQKSYSKETQYLQLEPLNSTTSTTYVVPVSAELLRLWDADTKNLSDFTTPFSFTVDTLGRASGTYAAGHAFYLAPIGYQIPPNSAGGFLGLFNTTTSDSSRNQIVTVKFDSFPNPEWEPNVLHVGINHNSIASAIYTPWKASYHSGDIADAEINYNATTHNLSVFWSYRTTSTNTENTSLSYQLNLMEILPEWVTVGIKEAKKNKGIAETENLTSVNYDLERGAGVPRRFSYVDLASAINNFSSEKKLGEGGFRAIYRGYLRDLDMVVAVKKISRGSKQGKKEYITKVKVISSLRHRNLVQPIGWCHDRGEFLLVYEFMPNGSLMWDPFPNFVPRGGPRGSHVISPSAFGPSKVRAEPITDPRRSGQSDPNHDSWGSEATRVCYLGAAARDSGGSEAPKSEGSEASRVFKLDTMESNPRLQTQTVHLMLSWIEAVGGGENQAMVAQKRSQKSRPVTVKKDLEVKESFEIARTREQLENTTSAVRDTWTAGKKPLQHLDSHLFGRRSPLSWAVRFKLGDFGLTRLMDHELGPQTTGLVGTLGYLAPEYVSTKRASKESDVYSFGVVALEIATGRKALNPMEEDTDMGLVKWVWDLYGKGELSLAMDEKLYLSSDKKQVECLMIVGLWCAHPDRNLRPTIRQALQVLKFEATLPSLPTKIPVPVYQIPTPSFSSGDPSITTSLEVDGR
ncbi:Tyrosine-protein kinase [Parasponia andersonii]|uniref:Tyrosine-protein kinase n=1 Tax=Parasponia andersonii TaxID=3476 RepID=A0A2P5A743_PARAD|nr:Tyrosine-protein kinase [Parasponia andersonii]